MDQLTDLKTILHSKRANLYYLEKCRVMQKDGRVVFLTEEKNANLYWNIPIANTTCLLLGTGTSITQAATRMLASAGVIIGFCGGDGTPLLMANEVEWLSPQSEYRPTEYVQGWLSFWFDETKRVAAAKYFIFARVNYLKTVWLKDKELQEYGFNVDDYEISAALNEVIERAQHATSVSELLQIEALLTKRLYRIASKKTVYGAFSRDRDSDDIANTFLNHGNYLAYGLAATTLWVLGIPHGFAVMHGKTRRGALVFDVADLIKDSIILPMSFIAAQQKLTPKEFRDRCLQGFVDHKSLDYMFEQVQLISSKSYWETLK